MKKYSKLEINGEWSSIDLETSKKVNVAFGSISLNVSDKNNEPISQWSYDSVDLVELNDEWAAFAPDKEETERLTIFDRDAIAYLLSLSEKRLANRLTIVAKWFLLIFLISVCSLFAYKYHRVSLEKLALSITSKEQEIFIGNLVFSSIKGLSVCKVHWSNNMIDTLIEKEMRINKGIIKVEFLSSFSKYSLLLPGGTLLISKNILNEDNGLMNFETLILNSLKLQKELSPIKIFFSNQKIMALIYYILGNYEALNFNIHLKFKLENLKFKSDSKLKINEQEWIKIRGLCI